MWEVYEFLHLIFDVKGIKVGGIRAGSGLCKRFTGYESEQL